MQELHSKLKVVPSIDPAAIYNSNGTKTGATINAQGFNHLEFVFQTGALTDGDWTTAIYGSNDSGMAGEVQLTNDAGAHPGLISADLSIAHGTDGSKTERQGVDVNKAGFQYYRQKATQASATTGGYVSGLAILGNPAVMPVASP